jgi:hypothetical protein
MNKHSFAYLAACLAAWAGLSPQLWAASGVNTPDPSLPPTRGSYMVNAATYHSTFGPVVLQSAVHSSFTNITRSPSGPDEIENFDSVVTGQVAVGLAPPVPITLMGPVTTIVFGKIGNTTGTFQTEMLSMNLSGPTPLGPIMIRESPTLPTLGSTSITDIGGGMYHIDSFFDVFTELSLDGGQTWTPSDGSAHVELCPEPATVLLGALALVGLGGVVRRRK